MLHYKLLSSVLCKQLIASRNVRYTTRKNIQVTVVGATNEVGANLALLAKLSRKIDNLELYDDDSKVKGIAMELNHIPDGPKVRAWTGDNELKAAIKNSHVILMVYREPRKPGDSREQMIAANAPAVQKLCRAIVAYNPDAFIAITTNPINSMVPFVSALMYKYDCYNPFKIFGVTHIDTARTRVLVADAMQINPSDVSVPVIGGHSEDTIVPIFSSMVPTNTLDLHKIDVLTRLVRKAGTEVVFRKNGHDSATLATAMAINEFLDLIIDAIIGREVTVNAFTANSDFGTRFFSGPTTVGPYGIIPAKRCYQLNDYETFLLNNSVPIINRDVGLGENYVQFVEMMKC